MIGLPHQMLLKIDQFVLLVGSVIVQPDTSLIRQINTILLIIAELKLGRKRELLDANVIVVKFFPVWDCALLFLTFYRLLKLQRLVVDPTGYVMTLIDKDFDFRNFTGLVLDIPVANYHHQNFLTQIKFHIEHPELLLTAAVLLESFNLIFLLKAVTAVSFDGLIT